MRVGKQPKAVAVRCGVLSAAKAVMQLDHLVVGLDRLMGLT
jgi:hypothetical protein